MSEPPVVVLVDADEPGNVGTAARAMKNFGFRDLRLIDPPPLDPDGEAYGFAGRAREDILLSARETTLEAVIEDYYTVGCTAVTNEDARRHVRYPFVTPDDLDAELAAVDARVALVFGRESTGLTNDELARIDRVCTIPASEHYPTLNLGQAVTVVLYSLRAHTGTGVHHVDPTHDRATEEDIERLYGRFDDLLAAIGHPSEKRPKANRMIRRLVGRAHPTDREVRTLMGILRRSTELILASESDQRRR